jgi:hypothetical protein
MGRGPHLHVAMPFAEKLADFLVLLLPIFALTILGTIEGGLAYSAVLELEIRRCYSITDRAALGHGHDVWLLEWSEEVRCNGNVDRVSSSEESLGL